MRNKIVKKAESWVGIKEGTAAHKEIIDTYNSHKPRARGYKLKYTDAWCAGTISALAISTGLTDYIPTEVSCNKMIELCKKKGIWRENENFTPSPGDLIFYDWQDNGVGDNKGTSEHVGIVQKVENKTIYVIEGNYKNAVGIRKIAVNGTYIRGFAIPKYKTMESTLTEKELIKMAQDVINGKYGNGAKRKELLGKNYAAVQKKVNELLKK